MTTFEHTLQSLSDRVDRFLEQEMPPETRFPATIHKAIRYSIFAGGKRLRPILAIAAYRRCGGRGRNILWAAGALEMLHTYSLIHDDLPCMDDDDLRRGKKTSHKEFGEGIAVLAGDALHALAFEWLAKAGDLRVISEVAQAIGTKGMIGGQVADLEAEGSPITHDELTWIHRAKTGALLVTSLRVGALLAGASPTRLRKLTSYGEKIGLAFQIVDDILDEISTPEQLGKSPGSDRKKDKATYAKLHGLEASRQMAAKLVEEAKAELAPRDPADAFFMDLADFIHRRMH